MAEAFGAADVQGLRDRRQAEGFAGMDGRVEVRAVDGREGIQVARRRVTRLGTGDVEAANTLVAEPDRELRDLTADCRLPHGRADDTNGQTAIQASLRKARHRRSDDLVQGQAQFPMKFGRETDLGIDDTVCREVLGAFRSDALDALPRLHDGDGVGERLEVEDQVVAVGSTRDHVPQGIRILRRQTGIAVVRGQLDDGAGAKPAVQVIVQQHLGRRDQVRSLDGHPPTLVDHLVVPLVRPCSYFDDEDRSDEGLAFCTGMRAGSACSGLVVAVEPRPAMDAQPWARGLLDRMGPRAITQPRDGCGPRRAEQLSHDPAGVANHFDAFRPALHECGLIEYVSAAADIPRE